MPAVLNRVSEWGQAEEEVLVEQTHVKILLLVCGLVEIDLQSRSDRTWSHSD